MKRVFDSERSAECVFRYKSGENVSVIARSMGVSRPSVANELVRQGVFCKRVKRRPEIVENGVLVPLTRGLTAIVDLCDYERISRYSWHATKSSWHKTWYARAKVNGKTVPLHRFLFGLAVGDPREVDHRNRNGLDNRRCNLRLCTPRENKCNQSTYRNNRLGTKGVTRRSESRYQARITVDGETVNLGCFKTVGEARAAYQRAAGERFGEFVSINN